ncbi:MAG: hypothetical protein C0465_17790 [Ralstonia sp.]|uniref:hypothetical protein n=1 Tax=Ralstonia sp. TaxID=54061 RepID=UPI00257B4A09|nr:hypothetical protein [Ralstonia sp.]MBA4232453.1 hypothetical protein [Ralstonia sp.]
MMNSRIIIGSRRSASVPMSIAAARPIPRRIPNEFYPTPPEATRALLSVETFDGSIWEPACGEGAIAKELSAAGNTVVATDLVDYGFGISGVDFLKESRPRARHVVTNPPYGSGLADAFIEQALRFASETRGAVAMLLNLSSLSHRRRTSWWKEKPPARLYAIDDIVCWPDHLYGPVPEYFTRHRYVWAVWTPDHRGPSAFWWLSAADFRGRRSVHNINERKRP